MTKFRRTPRTDGDITRARILDVAGKLFARLGYGGASSKLICEEAGADLAAINYHFGSRDALYRSVLVEGHKHLVNLEQLTRLAQGDLSPRDKLGVFIDGVVAGLTDEHSWHTRVCAREILAPSQHFASLVNEEVMPKFRIVGGIVSEITGIPVGDPALSRCVVSIMAPCLTLLVVDREAPSPPQELLTHPPADLAAHLKTFALAGLDAIAAQRRTPAS